MKKLKILISRFILYFIDINELLEKLNNNRSSQYESLVSISSESKLYEKVKIINMQNSKEKIVIGKHTHIRGDLVVFASGGRISIGDYCYIGEDSKIWSQDEIEIGNNVLIAHNVNIHDTNSHPINFIERRKDYSEIISSGFSKKNESIICKKIIIGDDVWIGFNSIILKGVEIGARSIIASGTVVTNSIPADVIVAGNPAVIIKTLDPPLL
jgi:acetyltransferase-like isoleucine patch superfamily enzyme